MGFFKAEPSIWDRIKNNKRLLSEYQNNKIFRSYIDAYSTNKIADPEDLLLLLANACKNFNRDMNTISSDLIKIIDRIKEATKNAEGE